VQAPLALGDGEFVIRLGEVVHADKDVARIGQAANGELDDLQLGIRAWQFGLADAPLRLGQVGQMRVVVNRQAIGRKLDDFIERVVEADDILLGQAVDQIDRQSLEAELTRGVHHHAGFVEALNAIHGLLHARIEILHTDTHAVETQLREQANGLAVDFARIDFDGIFAIGQHLEMLPGHFHQAAHLVVGQEGGGATAPMQLDHFTRAVERLGLQGHFLAEILQVLGRTAMILGNNLVTGAVIADGIAERDVKV